MRDKPDGKSQSERFKEAARELECDDSKERFEAALRVIGRQKPKPPPDKGEQSDDPKPGQ